MYFAFLKHFLFAFSAKKNSYNNVSPGKQTTKKRRIESMYDQIVQSIEDRKFSETQIVNGIADVATATEKMAASIDKLTVCINLLAEVLQKNRN